MNETMTGSVRARILVWLLIVLLPVVTASVVAIHIVDRDLSERVVADLENVRRLEVARMDQILGSYAREARRFSTGSRVIEFVDAVDARRAGTIGDDVVIGGEAGFDVVDAMSERPLQQLAEALQANSRASAARAVEFRVVGTDGTTLGQTAGFTWEPYEPRLTETVMATARPRFGNAFRNADGDDRLGHVTPVVNRDRDVVGAIEIELELGPIVDFVSTHEAFGQTSEAFIVQPDAAGDAELITPLRFDRDAAFSRVVPAAEQLPINHSLDAVGGLTVTAPDYRDVESILSIETIRSTGWGLVVKIDRSEALAPVDNVRTVIAAAGAAAAAGVLLGWALFLRPLGARLRRAALEARNIAGGEHAPIGDTSRDEIGDMSRTIDRLAEDLARDRAVRAEFERELVRRATHDDLTGLVNRQHATALVVELLSDDRTSSLLFLDLDGFKSINDTYGHSVGDEVLVSVARRLNNVAPAESIVARWGGDEFVIVLPGMDADDTELFAQQARSAFEQPIPTSVGPQIVRWSLGASTTTPGLTLDQMLLDADHRMFAEKQARKGRLAVSSATLRDVEDALVEQRIDVHYQPVVDVDVGGACTLWGAEALVRLRLPDGRIVPPTEFLEAAQDNHLGAAIDERVAELAIAQLGRWREDGFVDEDFTLSLNLCEASTRDPELAHRLRGALECWDVAPSVLILEISEETRHIAPATIAEMRELGVVIAIDDVGVGRSGVARLVDTKAEVGKIDRRWTSDLVAPDASGPPIVAGLAGLCRSLGITVVVEGVETVEQRDVLIDLGLTRMQGFLFGRPMPANGFEMAWRAPASTGAVRPSVQPV